MGKGRGTFLKKAIITEPPWYASAPSGHFRTSSNRPAKNVQSEALDPLFRRSNQSRKLNGHRSSACANSEHVTSPLRSLRPDTSPNKLFSAAPTHNFVQSASRSWQVCVAKNFYRQRCAGQASDPRLVRVANGREQWFLGCWTKTEGFSVEGDEKHGV
ncbi:hypothetical protein NPIL_532271 [Nephila pilipes]|uniref:Uncharacterized protein n=1 Tax=Nephila pilipes TaxID=299642 RepID=A0A8X6QKG4_NEPPI|nr:hypothetical protein NPIL_532271 [Nephila pilipes]